MGRARRGTTSGSTTTGFTLYALDVPTLGLSGSFGGPEALAAMEGHVLAESSWTGTYTLNPSLL